MSKDLSPLYREATLSTDPPPFASPILEDAVQGIATITQAPVAIAMQSVLGILSLVTQSHANVQTLGGAAPLSLFLLTIGRSGERKSGCNTIASRAIMEHQKLSLAHYTRKLKVFEAAQKVDGSSVVDRSEDDAMENSPATEMPINPTMLFGDVTYEAVLEHFKDGNPSIGLMSDDGGQFFGGYSMKRDNKLKTAAGLSRLWDGASIDRHRAGTGSQTFYGRRATLHFMVQPQVANDVLTDDILVGQGLLSRVLPAFPESKIGLRTIYDSAKRQEEVACAKRKLIAFDECIQKILKITFPASPADPKILLPKLLGLSEDAAIILTEFYNRVESALRPGGHFEQIEGFASKIAEQACRIAGVLTVFDDPAASQVSSAVMINGIEFAEWYLQEMCRLCECGFVSTELRQAERLRRWLVENRSGELVTTRDITRNGPRPAFNAEIARKLMQILSMHDCVELQPRNALVNGRRTKWSWRVLS